MSSTFESNYRDERYYIEWTSLYISAAASQYTTATQNAKQSIGIYPRVGFFSGIKGCLSLWISQRNHHDGDDLRGKSRRTTHESCNGKNDVRLCYSGFVKKSTKN